MASTSEISEMPTKVLIISEEKSLGDFARIALNEFRNATSSLKPLRVNAMAALMAALAAAERDTPDLIILMILNPEMLFSDEECHRFRASRASPALRDIPILLICVEKIYHGFVEKQARRFAANGYVVVPIDFQEFLTAYDVVLGGETYYPPWPDKLWGNHDSG